MPFDAPSLVVRSDAEAEPSVDYALRRLQNRQRFAFFVRAAQLAFHHAREYALPAVRGQHGDARHGGNRRSPVFGYDHPQGIHDESADNLRAVVGGERPSALQRRRERLVCLIVHRVAAESARHSRQKRTILVLPDKPQFRFSFHGTSLLNPFVVSLSNHLTDKSQVYHTHPVYPVGFLTGPRPSRPDAAAHLSARMSAAAPSLGRRPRFLCRYPARPG